MDTETIADRSVGALKKEAVVIDISTKRHFKMSISDLPKGQARKAPGVILKMSLRKIFLRKRIPLGEWHIE